MILEVTVASLGQALVGENTHDQGYPDYNRAVSSPGMSGCF